MTCLRAAVWSIAIPSNASRRASSWDCWVRHRMRFRLSDERKVSPIALPWQMPRRLIEAQGGPVSQPPSKGPIWAADVIEARKFRNGRTSRIDWRGIYPALSSFLGSSTNALTGERACRLRRTTDRLEVGRMQTVRNGDPH